MERRDVHYLRYITAPENLPSILRHGILSWERAQRVEHLSIANEDVQIRRGAILLPNGRPLHEHANVYFNARNGMMYAVAERDLCIVRVNATVLDIPGALYSDRNAAAHGAVFGYCPDLAALDQSAIYRGQWNSQIEMQMMMAEVLVPDLIPPHYIDRVYVRTRDRDRVAAIGLPVQVEAYSAAFFE